MQFIISDTNQPTITNMSESEARRGVEDAGDKIKAGTKAIGKKAEDPIGILEQNTRRKSSKRKLD